MEQKVWFRRRAKHGNRRPFDESRLPPTAFLTVAEATEEALLLTEYAARMSVKNRFIQKILADKQPWFLERSRDDARTVLTLLARESETDAKNLDKIITRYRDNPQSERDSQGYGFNDLSNMEHRRDVSLDVAKRLREQSTDDTYITELVNTARRDAWREVAANIENNLDIEYLPVDADYERHRDDRMRALIDEDLAALLAATQTETSPTE